MGVLKFKTLYGIELPASYWKLSLLQVAGESLTIQAEGFASEGAYGAGVNPLPLQAFTTISTEDPLISKTLDILRSLLYQNQVVMTNLGLEGATPALDQSQVATSIQELANLYAQLPDSPGTPAPGTYLPDWEGLTSALRGTPLFGLAFSTQNANAWSLLLAALTSSHDFNDLAFAIYGVRLGMAVDFTPEQIAEINAMLVAHNFAFVVS